MITLDSKPELSNFKRLNTLIMEATSDDSGVSTDYMP